MYIKSIIIDGFKSYGRRTEIHGFDPEFTAITGLNGTGKSNILDSICFVLGISNLGQVRATSLQDLIFKGGQAGITKATVTLVFDNTNQDQCPLGYEKCREISVARQIVAGGKNKYMINGKNVQNKKIVDLFCSVQLNVNNPNFLIMQGRITKVLNMKPQEVLSMIEEAAGTSLYESKREATNKLIEKKDVKIRETNVLLAEEVEPKLDKLRQERAALTEFQKICRDIEYLTRIHISFKYLKQKEALQNTEKNIENTLNAIQGTKDKIKENEEEMVKCEEFAKEIQTKIDEESGGALNELEEELAQKTLEEAKASGKMKAAQASLEQDKTKLKSLTKSINDDKGVLAKKENEMQKAAGLFESLKEAYENDNKAYTDAQKKFEAVTQGLSTNEDGEASSLQDQLMTAKKQVVEAQTTIKKCEMELKHNKNLLRQKQGETQTSDAAYIRDKKLYDKLDADIKRITGEMSRLRYEDGTLETLEQNLNAINQELRNFKSQLDRKQAYRFELEYDDPEPGFDRSKVRGMLGKLFKVKDEKNFLALSMCGGGHIYSYVTDDDVTSKKILQKGRLKKRVTIFPINKITFYPIEPNKIVYAQRLVGAHNVDCALNLIEFHSHFDPVMKYVFGRTLVCSDINVAKKVTYDPNIMCRSVTLEGDIVDPEGTLSGGSKPKGPVILSDLDQIKQIEDAMQQKEEERKRINHEIASLQNVARQFNAMKEKLELSQHELQACQQRLAQTTFQQHQQEIEELKLKIQQLEENLVNARKQEESSSAKAKNIQEKLSDAKGYRERELKAASEAMKVAKKKSEQSQVNWKKHEQEYQTFKLEIEELKESIEAAVIQQNELKETVDTIQKQLDEFFGESKSMSMEVNELKNKIKAQKDKIHAQNKELKSYYVKKDKLGKQNQELLLEIKKKENEVTKIRTENKDAFQRISHLEDKFVWIKEDREFFGAKNTRYDYSKEDPVEAGRKLHVLEDQKAKMERNVNMKAMLLLDREEEHYKETMRRKKIVDEDKKKIQGIISKMDEHKKRKLDDAWRSVDRNFGSIFSTLLPGAQAQLRPVHQNSNLMGLEIRVGFNGMWKESLGELSGGQRSLVALSLVLAMLKFSPAPLYILDEVDAALDMSHTQNIGNMLKAHFRNSQFIIVSLKDGMFNNANVLFRTKFEEGVSAVTRTVNQKTLGKNAK